MDGRKEETQCQEGNGQEGIDSKISTDHQLHHPINTENLRIQREEGLNRDRDDHDEPHKQADVGHSKTGSDPDVPSPHMIRS